MSAVGLKQLSAGAEGLDQIGARHAAARTLGALPFLAEDDDRTVQRAADLARGDAHDSRVPISMDDVTGEVAHRLGLGHGFFGDLLVDLLAFTIDGVELRGIAEAIIRIIRKQETQRQRRIGQTAARVDAGSDTIRDIDRGEHAAGLHAADGDEGAQALPASFAEGLEAVGREDTVLGAQRDQVGDGAEGGQVEVVLHRDRSAAFVAGEAQDLQDAMDQLKDQSGGTERLPRGVRGVVDARVDEDAADAGFLGHVVVDHDDVDAFSSEAFDLGLGVGTAIERDEELRLRLGEDAFERGH